MSYLSNMLAQYTGDMGSALGGSSSGGIDPSILEQLFGGQQQTSSAPASFVIPPTSSTNVNAGSTADTSVNPFSSYAGAPIPGTSTSTTSSGSVAPSSTSTTPASLMSSFQALIQPYVSQLQTIAQNANTANTTNQNTLNSQLNPSSQAAAAAPTGPSGAALTGDVNSAVQQAISQSGGNTTYGAFNNIITQYLTQQGFTPQQIQAVTSGENVADSYNAGGDMQNAKGGNSAAELSSWTSNIDNALNNQANMAPATNFNSAIGAGSTPAPSTLTPSTGSNTGQPSSTANPASSSAGMAGLGRYTLPIMQGGTGSLTASAHGVY